MASRTNRAHDARARAREARAVMLAERQAQDERIEDAMAAALLAIEDRAAAIAQVEQQERSLAAAVQRLSLESVPVRDIMTMTGLGEKYVTRLLRMQPAAAADTDTADTELTPDDAVAAGVGGRVEVGVGADRAAG